MRLYQEIGSLKNELAKIDELSTQVWKGQFRGSKLECHL